MTSKIQGSELILRTTKTMRRVRTTALTSNTNHGGSRRDSSANVNKNGGHKPAAALPAAAAPAAMRPAAPAFQPNVALQGEECSRSRHDRDYSAEKSQAGRQKMAFLDSHINHRCGAKDFLRTSDQEEQRLENEAIAKNEARQNKVQSTSDGAEHMESMEMYGQQDENAAAHGNNDEGPSAHDEPDSANNDQGVQDRHHNSGSDIADIPDIPDVPDSGPNGTDLFGNIFDESGTANRAQEKTHIQQQNRGSNITLDVTTESGEAGPDDERVFPIDIYGMSNGDNEPPSQGDDGPVA